MGMGGIAPEWFAKEGVAIGRVIDKHRWRLFEESMASCGSWHLYRPRNCTNYPAELMSVVCRVQCTRTVAGFDYDSCCRKRCNEPDRKSTRLNSSHVSISYAVFCLK